MNTWLALAVVMFVLLLPVRLAAWLLKAPRQGWWASLKVLFFGTAFVAAFGNLAAGGMVGAHLDTLRPGFRDHPRIDSNGAGAEGGQGRHPECLICAVYSFTVSAGGGFVVRMGG